MNIMAIQVFAILVITIAMSVMDQVMDNVIHVMPMELISLS